MIPGFYIYIYLLIGLLALFYDTKKKVSEIEYQRVFMSLYVVLALLMAFRYKVGVDTAGYMDDFQYIHPLNQLSINDFIFLRYQPLYIILNSLCKTIFDNFVSLQILQSFLLFHSLYLLLKKLLLRKIYILFLFFGFVYMALQAGMRECFGLSFCFYGLYFYMDRKWYYYYLFVVLGFLCHSGMIVFFVFPLIKLFKKVTVWNVAILILLLTMIPTLMGYQELLGLFVDENDSILRYQLESSYTFSITAFIHNLLQFLAILFFVVIGFNKQNPQYHKKEEYKKDFIYFGILYLLIISGASFMPILYRYNSHFSIFFYFVISQCFERVRVKKDNVIIPILFVLFAYSPVSSFIKGMKEYPTNYYYCSVFSSDYSKSQMDRFDGYIYKK